MNEEALVELGLTVFATEFGTDLFGGVIKEQFVVTAAFVFLTLDAGEGLVGRQAADTAEGGRTMRAVINDAGDDRTIDVAFDEVDDDFLADPGDILGTPSGSGTGHGDTDPGGGTVVEVRPAFGVILGALPVELDFDATVFVGEDFFAFWANDGGGGEPASGGFLVGSPGKFWDDRDVAADGSEAVAVDSGRRNS